MAGADGDDSLSIAHEAARVLQAAKDGMKRLGNLWLMRRRKLLNGRRRPTRSIGARARRTLPRGWSTIIALVFAVWFVMR